MTEQDPTAIEPEEPPKPPAPEVDDDGTEPGEEDVPEQDFGTNEEGDESGESFEDQPDRQIVEDEAAE